MINSEKLKHVLNAYRKDFHKKYENKKNKSHWESEKYKWIAIKHFQDNWNLDADNFVEMFKEATSKCYNLLDSQNYFPRGMIVAFAEVDAETVRKMFRDLFDETKSTVDRVNKFIQESERIRSTYGASKWKSHYQNVNSISTYLWLKYPDKYYIYKYSECKEAASVLESDFTVKKGAKSEVLITFTNFYNEIAAELSKDTETLEMFHSALTSECYTDPKYRTLTIDIGFYISRYYSKTAGNKEEIETPIETVYWPSEEQYPISITKDEWKKYIKDIEMQNHQGCMAMLKALMELGGEASCKKLSTVYGGTPTRYIGSAVNIGKRAKKYFNLAPCIDGDAERYFAIPFLGRSIIEDGGNYYLYKIRPELYEALSEIDLSEINPYISDNEDEKRYWWLNANPRIWSFSDITVGEEQTYTLYNENGNKRRIFQNFLDAKPGDMIIGYESNPVKQIVALAKITAEQDGDKICFVKTEGISNPIDYQTLKECTELKNMECFQQPQGSLFKLSKDEYDFIMDMVREENPISDIEKIDRYNKDNFLNEVYMSEKKYDTLVTVLENKKNIILQGAPGVGKTFAAKRLAYSIMGKKDESCIEFIQFHQNYSYEDFIMGYKPVNAGFELKYGIFYRFCQKASNNPDKKYFFIIDEINRGNMSKIFGELLMLIEKDYRDTKATLAYNGLPFSVPKNLYIIGMMNTADRSLAMIDYALRRRFSFFEIEPAFDSDGFKNYLNSLKDDTLNSLILKIKELNRDIESDKSLGKGFCIGHSYFCSQTESTIEWLKSIVEYDILPMLNEYWFDDLSKVQHWENVLCEVFR